MSRMPKEGEVYELPNREAKMVVETVGKYRFDMVNVDRDGDVFIEVSDTLDNFDRWGFIPVEDG